MVASPFSEFCVMNGHCFEILMQTHVFWILYSYMNYVKYTTL